MPGSSGAMLRYGIARPANGYCEATANSTPSLIQPAL